MRRPAMIGLLGLSAVALGGCAASTSPTPLPEQVAAGTYQGEAAPTHRIVQQISDAGVPLDTSRLDDGERLAVIHAGRYPNGAYRMDVEVRRNHDGVEFVCTVKRSQANDVAHMQAVIQPWQAYRIPAHVEQMAITDCGLSIRE